MSVIDKDVDVAVRWSTAERVQALKRIVGKKSIEKVCWRSPRRPRHCRRLPRWFVVWFVIAMALFCRDSYRQVFRWLNRFHSGGTPGRSTLCEARKSVVSFRQACMTGLGGHASVASLGANLREASR